MNSLNKKTIKIISIISILAIIFIMIPYCSIHLTKKVAAEENIETSRRIGCWWWQYDDGANATIRTKYLNFLEEHGITEIYYYAYSYLASSSGRDEIHTFVSEAKKHGMRVSILYEYADSVMRSETSTKSVFEKYLGYYKQYNTQYPNEPLYGFHFDIEPGVSESILKNYVNNFISALSVFKTFEEENNMQCDVEVDVGCGWGSFGTNITLNGVKGIYNIIASNVDTMTLMSYRDTGREIVSMGYEAMNACNQYGCAVLFGAETDDAHEGDQVDFSGESVQYLMEQMDVVFDRLSEKNLKVEYGMAIHHARSFNNLRLISTTTEAMKSQLLFKKEGLGIHVDTTNSYIYTDPDFVAALHADYEKYGRVDDTNSYYKITIGLSTGRQTYVYPCLWDSTGEYDIWPKNGNADYPYGTTSSTKLKNIASFIRSIYYSKAQQYASLSGEEDGVYIYLEDRTTMDIDSITLEVFHPTRILEESSDISQDSNIESEDSSDVSTLPAIIGDANEDGSVDMKDILSIRKNLAGLDVHIDMDLSDVNFDGLVDMKDILQLRKFLAGLPSTLDSMVF